MRLLFRLLFLFRSFFLCLLCLLCLFYMYYNTHFYFVNTQKNRPGLSARTVLINFRFRIITADEHQIHPI